VVWAAQSRRLAHHGPGVDRFYAGLLGTRPRSAGGTLPELGATIPGFAVTDMQSGDQLTLAGRHRFSRYELSFHLTGAADGTVLTARSSASFPGPHGLLYRMLVIESGAHRMIVRRMLRDIAGAAERA
jgi:hypothetical protein